MTRGSDTMWRRGCASEQSAEEVGCECACKRADQGVMARGRANGATPTTADSHRCAAAATTMTRATTAAISKRHRRSATAASRTSRPREVSELVAEGLRANGNAARWRHRKPQPPAPLPNPERRSTPPRQPEPGHHPRSTVVDRLKFERNATGPRPSALMLGPCSTVADSLNPGQNVARPRRTALETGPRHCVVDRLNPSRNDARPQRTAPRSVLAIASLTA